MMSEGLDMHLSLKDLKSLLVVISISGLCKSTKGPVKCVLADSLEAHLSVRFLESFSGYMQILSWFRVAVKWSTSCRFSKKNKWKTCCAYLKSVTKKGILVHCCGIKRQCVLSEKCKYFHVIPGYLPDLLHELLEGIILLQLANH